MTTPPLFDACALARHLANALAPSAIGIAALALAVGGEAISAKADMPLSRGCQHLIIAGGLSQNRRIGKCDQRQVDAQEKRRIRSTARGTLR